MDIADIALLEESHASSLNEDHLVGYGATDPICAPLSGDTCIKCRAVAKRKIFREDIVEGLMLLPQKEGVLRRIGFFRLYRDDMLTIRSRASLENSLKRSFGRVVQL